MLTPEELKEARAQLSAQVESIPDGPRKEAARKQLASMSDEMISAMVEQQRDGGEQTKDEERRSVFRAIVDGSIPSKKLDENKDAIAVVSIRPVSRGHTIVIPKILARDAKEIPSRALTMAKKIARKMTSKLGAKSTEIQTSALFDEVIINVIPSYDKKMHAGSPPYEASEKELEEVWSLLRIVHKPKKPKLIKKETRKEETPVLKLKRRIP